jgi:hypothetical protein
MNVHEKILKLEKDLNVATYRPYRYQFQKRIFKQVLDGLNENLHDHVYIKEKLKSLGKKHDVCTKCAKIYSKKRSICNKCGHNPDNFPERSELYGTVPSGHPQQRPLIKLGEIIGVNPNSKDSIKNIL